MGCRLTYVPGELDCDPWDKGLPEGTGGEVEPERTEGAAAAEWAAATAAAAVVITPDVNGFGRLLGVVPGAGRGGGAGGGTEFIEYIPG